MTVLSLEETNTLIDMAVILNYRSQPHRDVPKVSPDAIIHTTIGIYPNGSHKVNGVAEEHLKDHIDYNLGNRPGRALMVDGVVVYSGGCNPEELERYIAKNKLTELRITRCTVPYQ